MKKLKICEMSVLINWEHPSRPSAAALMTGGLYSMTVNTDANKLLLYLFCSLVRMGKGGGGGELQMFLKTKGWGDEEECGRWPQKL